MVFLAPLTPRLVEVRAECAKEDRSSSRDQRPIHEGPRHPAFGCSEAAPDTRFARRRRFRLERGSWAASTSARMQSGLMGNRLAVKRLKSHGNRAGPSFRRARNRTFQLWTNALNSMIGGSGRIARDFAERRLCKLFSGRPVDTCSSGRAGPFPPQGVLLAVRLVAELGLELRR